MNDYGQFPRVKDQNRAVLNAFDDLFSAIELVAYVGYTPEDLIEEADIDGVHKITLKAQCSTHGFGGLNVLEPHILAEGESIKRELWQVFNRRVERLKALGEGNCLACGKPSDRPKRRFCSRCER